MHDHMIKATVPGVRAFAAVSTQLVEEARRRHDCYPVAAAALGRTMTGALLLAANLKTKESVTIRISGNGSLGDISADATADGVVRGYVVHPQTDLPLNGAKLDVGGAVGAGMIHVTRFTGLKQPFTGSAELVSGEIAEDITQYLAVSEQTPSSVALGVLVQPDLSVSAAGGFMIQALPDSDACSLAVIEANLACLPPVSQLVAEGKSAREILAAVFSGLPITFYEESPLTFRCACSREKVENMLLSIERSELVDMAREGHAEVCCHFCAEKYQFDKSELEALLASSAETSPVQ